MATKQLFLKEILIRADGTSPEGNEFNLNGVDFTPFLHKGYITIKSSERVEDIAGYPISIDLTEKGWVLTAAVMDTKAGNLVKKLKEDKTPTRFGLAGKIVKRNGKVIEECVVHSVGIFPEE